MQEQLQNSDAFSRATSSYRSAKEVHVTEEDEDTLSLALGVSCSAPP